MKQDGFLDKIEQVESMIDSFKKESLNESMIKKVIKIQKLVLVPPLNVRNQPCTVQRFQKEVQKFQQFVP